MRVGVELRLAGDPGELFADARALETAGVDSFWAPPDRDQLTLLAAVAAVTLRARIVALDVTPESGGTAMLDRLSRGRVAAAASHGEELRVPAAEGEDERWTRSDVPVGRAAWRELRDASEAAGFVGIVLPNGPRLLDLLRNPDVEDDRPDLRLAFG